MGLFTIITCPTHVNFNDVLPVDIVTVIFSGLAVIATLMGYIVIPFFSRKNDMKKEFYDLSAEFLKYLSEVVSNESFEGVPTAIRNYSLKIHLFFGNGKAPEKLSETLESLFQKAKERKAMVESGGIEHWETAFRDTVRELRVELAQYTKVFK